MKSIKNYVKDIRDKRVLLRVDLNVPIKNGKVADDYKIISQLETIRFLLRYNCRIIIVSHLGKPKAGEFERKFSLSPVAKRLEQLLHHKIKFVNDCVGLKAGTSVARMKDAEIVMLENIRFELGEKENSSKLAKSLASLADVYVNNAFAVSHRKDASVCAIRRYLPAFMGILTEQEINHLNKAIKPKKPLVTIIGGSKISTKIALIKNLQKKSYKVLIGGALANNFLLAKGFEVGKSLIDEDSLAFAKKFKKENVLFPVDVIVKNEAEKIFHKKLSEVDKTDSIMDIGPETVKLYTKFIKEAQTIIWNGPMGMFEEEKFSHGTKGIARSVALRSKGKAFGVAGGGETVEALRETGMMDYVDWVSTGGGAMLAYLGEEAMPGLE